MNLLQRKIEDRGYLEKSRFDRWKPGKSTCSPKTWNHPMVIAVIFGGAVCSKHTLKVDVSKKVISVNVRVFCECKSNLPDRRPSINWDVPGHLVHHQSTWSQHLLVRAATFATFILWKVVNRLTPLHNLQLLRQTAIVMAYPTYL